MPTSSTSTPRIEGQHHASRAAYLLNAIALSLLVSACGAGGNDAAPPEPPVGTSVTTVMTSSGPAHAMVEPTATIPLGEHVDGGLVTDDAVWAVVTDDETLYRIDPDTNSVVQQVPAPGIGHRFDIGHGAAWIPDFDGNVVRRVELDSGTVVAEIPTGQNPEGISVTGDAVWVANHRGGTVTRVDPTTNAVVATIEVGPSGPAGPQAIAASAERVWVGVPNIGKVVVIDATTNSVASHIDSVATCGEMKILDASVWVTNCFETHDVAIIDATGDEARPMQAAGPAGTPMYIDGDVWLATISLDEPIGQLLRIDPATLEILDSVVTDPPAYIMGHGFDSVWEFSWDAGAVIRLPIDALVHRND